MSDGGKGSSRRPGAGYQASHDRIFGARCSTCRGRGEVSTRNPDPALLPITGPCPTCKGEPDAAP